MKHHTVKMLAGAVPVLVAGLLIMQWQLRELSHRRSEAASSPPAEPVPPAPAKVQPLLTTAPPPAEQALAHPELLATLEQAILSRLNPKALDEMLDLENAMLVVRMKTAADISEAEWKTAAESAATRRQALLKAAETADTAIREQQIEQAEAEHTARIAALLGPERTAKWQAAETALRRTIAESVASDALHRVSRVIPLDAARRDALYTALHARAAQQPCDIPGPFYVEGAVEIKELPPPPDLSSHLDAILTEEQKSVYGMNRTARNFQFNSLMHILSENMIPAIKTVIVDTLGQDAAK